MNPDLPEHVKSAIEKLCTLGCTRVNEIIAQLETGNTVDEIEHLDPQELQSVLHELKQIMSVYDISNE